MDRNTTESSTSPFSEQSNYSDGSNLTDSQQFITSNFDTIISDEGESNEDNRVRKQNNRNGKSKEEIHRLIEKNRRETEKERLHELSTLIPTWYESKSSKISQLSLLNIATNLLNKINLRYQYDPLLPSFLTEAEINFLNVEASNGFLFVTTIEQSLFRIIHVTDSIYRILNLSPEQWLNENIFTFIHPDDLFQVENQFLSLTQNIGKQISLQCRIKQGDNTYSLLTIDGMIKKIDPSLKPVSTNECGFWAFIGLCHKSLINEYSEKNLNLYKDLQSLIFACRCSSNDWKIFLVDRSITTFPSVSFDFYRDKSILDFIYINERFNVHKALLNSILTGKDELNNM